MWSVEHATVRLADFSYGFGRILREACSGIGTKQCECLLLAERVPEVFKPHRGPAMALCPQERDHLSEGPNAPGTAGTRTVQNSSHAFREQLVVRPSIPHESGQRVGGIKLDVLIAKRGHV